jgi:FkbM family methyltransferase
MSFFRSIQRKYHPLHLLRSTRCFRWFQNAFDIDFPVLLSGYIVWVRFLRNLSLILSLDAKEVKIAFSSILVDNRWDVFLDVGSNIGSFSWIASRHQVKFIFAFEPDPDNCRLMMKSIAQNCIANIFVLPFAVSEDLGVSSFYLDNVSGSTGSLVSDGFNPFSLHAAYAVSRSVPVPTISLDSFAEFCANKRVLIKIDVEGAELSVLRGALGLVKSVLPVIVCESFDPGALAELNMFSLGYSVFPLDENGNYLFSPPGFNLPSCLDL